MTTFSDFWAVAEQWRFPYANDAKPAAIAWHKAIKDGTDPQEIILGAKGYARAMSDQNVRADLWNSAAKFIAQERWPRYVRYELEAIEREQEAAKELAMHTVRLRATDLMARRKSEIRTGVETLSDTERAEADRLLAAHENVRVMG